MEALDNVLCLFEDFMEEGEENTLETALQQLKQLSVYPADILPALQAFKADPRYKARAIQAVRQHFGLPLIPGPVCQR